MPASLTRTCPRCKLEKRSPEDFRELDQQEGPGRPPRYCRDCRHAVAPLQELYERNVAKREHNRDVKRGHAARHYEQIIAARNALHPNGTKTGPAAGGCGETLNFEDFLFTPRQSDGLDGFCRQCRHDHALKTLEKYSA